MKLDLRKDHIAIQAETMQDRVYLEKLFSTDFDGPIDSDYHIKASSAGSSILLFRRTGGDDA